jgi:hypothetical protein
MKTNLETVAAQRDELAMKLRAMARELAEAKAEIARMKAFGYNGGYVDPVREELAQRIAENAGFVPPPSVLSVAPIPAPPEVVTTTTYIDPTMPMSQTETPPKPKRSRLFGGK